MPSGDGATPAPGFDREAVTEILRPGLERLGLAGPNTAEGLRQRKKRLLRQLITDTATHMFLERGFDEVTVREIAEACDVSEKTVFNYFPTKESLLLDREEYDAALIREALRDRGDDASLVDSVLRVIEAEIGYSYGQWAVADDPERPLGMMRRFMAMLSETPSLAAAVQALQERLKQVAAEALAARAGVNPDDPEPQLAAVIVMGLWSYRYRSAERHIGSGRSVKEVRDAVLDDVRRAARVADAGLSSFNLVVQPKTGRDQLREAAEITNEARKQVVAAVKRARDAWKQVLQEAKAHHEAAEQAGEHARRPGPGHQARLEAKQQARQARREAREVRRGRPR
jgi:AcrR family transcriptional regulator